jgi:transposase
MSPFTAQSILGIDIAKAKLDTHFQRIGSADKPIHRLYENTALGHDQLLSWLATQQVGQVHVCLEATGTYGRAVALRLYQAGYRVSIVNPLRIKRYGESELLRVKTDKSDAALIARFCLTQQPDPWMPPSSAQQQLQDLVRALADLQRLHQQERCRQQSGSQSLAVMSVTSSVLICLETQMESLQIQIEAHIQAHESLRTPYDLLLSICGIGKRTATVLLGELGDLSRFPTVRALVAYVGLAPHLHRSGTSVHGPSPLSKHGHAAIRKALYFPALSAVRHNPAIRTLYQRLLAQGKPKMVALVAAMRKLLHQIYGVLHSGHVFDPAYVSAPPARTLAAHSGQ